MKISLLKQEKICEQILLVLFINSPKPLFTSQIAQEIARDEEFVKSLLSSLKKKGLIIQINKNPSGKSYLKRSRWILSEKVYSLYKEKQKI